MFQIATLVLATIFSSLCLERLEGAMVEVRSAPMARASPNPATPGVLQVRQAQEDEAVQRAIVIAMIRQSIEEQQNQIAQLQAQQFASQGTQQAQQFASQAPQQAQQVVSQAPQQGQQIVSQAPQPTVTVGSNVNAPAPSKEIVNTGQVSKAAASGVTGTTNAAKSTIVKNAASVNDAKGRAVTKTKDTVSGVTSIGGRSRTQRNNLRNRQTDRKCDTTGF